MSINQLGDGSTDGVVLSVSGGKVGFYGSAPVAQRSTAAAHATSLFSASSYATVGSNLVAFIVEVQNTLAGLNVWSD